LDINTVEICWNILQRYIKSSDEAHAVSHLVTEIIDAGIKDEELESLAAIDETFADAVAEHKDSNEDEYWHEDEDSWE
jgi:hypothetical protein